jgi:hypothetical protein
MRRAVPSLAYLIGLLAILLAAALVPTAHADAATVGEAQAFAADDDGGDADRPCPCDGSDVPLALVPAAVRVPGPASLDRGHSPPAFGAAAAPASFRARGPPGC